VSSFYGVSDDNNNDDDDMASPTIMMMMKMMMMMMMMISTVPQHAGLTVTAPGFRFSFCIK
jgi:hypothetical protein